MGQKVNPHGIRVGVIKEWDSKWYAEADFADNLVEDHKIREFSISVPFRIPVLNNADSYSVRINFLSHFLPPISRQARL